MGVGMSSFGSFVGVQEKRGLYPCETRVPKVDGGVPLFKLHLVYNIIALGKSKL